MSTLLAVDPGVVGDGCACAEFRDGRLRYVYFERSDYATVEVGASTVVVERPAYQGQRSANARIQDLVNLAWHGARFAALVAGALGARLVEYTPQEWKGSARKPQHHLRIWRALDDVERAVLGGEATFKIIRAAAEKGARERWKRAGGAYYPKSFVTHNLLDATGLGLVHLGRLPK